MKYFQIPRNFLAKALLGAALLVASFSRADVNAEETEFAHKLETRLEIPYKVWGKQWQAGAVRALYFVNAGGYSGSWTAPDTRLRDVIEIQKRFDFPGEAIMYNRASGFFGQGHGRERALKLLEKNDFDVVVLAGFSMKVLPDEFQFRIMEKVAGGTGLVIIENYPAYGFLTEKRRIARTPETLISALPALEGKTAAEITTAYQLGKGRCAVLKYPAWALTRALSYSKERFNEYDYQLMQVGRAIQWSAGKEARVQMNAEAQYRKDGMPQPVFHLTAQQDLSLTADVEWRRIADNWRMEAKAIPVKIQDGKGVIVAEFPLPDAGDGFPATLDGRYIVDIRLTSESGLEGYGAIDMEAVSSQKLENLVLYQEWVEPEGTQHVTVVANDIDSAKDARIVWRAVDSHGRVLAQATTAARGFNQWVFQTPKTATIAMTVQAALVCNGREINMQEGLYTVARRQREHFGFLQWDTPRGVLSQYGWQQLREAGYKLSLVSSMSNSRFDAETAYADISLVPYSTRILADKNSDNTMKPVCWNDEEAAEAHVQQIVSNQTMRRRQGVYCYSLGDEGVTEGLCAHPACLKRYQDYLKLQYGTIAKLNASWCENYADFAEIQLLDKADLYESKAINQEKYSRWYDRQAFARWNLMQFSKRFVDKYLTLDEKAVTGFEGTGGFGDDIPLISSINTFYSPYPSIGDDILRSVADRSLLRSNWMGYSKTGDALSDAAWRTVMKECNSSWYWMWTGAGSWIGYLTPSLDYYPAIEDLKNEMAPVRNGLGDLLMHLKTSHSGIAVLYNLPSALSSSLANGATFNNAKTTHESWARFLYQLGYDFKYLDTARITGGELLKGGYKVLLLPFCQGLSEAECEAVLAFAREGGTVIADVRPAIMDEHCNLRKKGGLDELFGIRRKGLPAGILANLEEYAISESVLDSGIETLNGVPARIAALKDLAGKDAHAPVMVTNLYGLGKGILLNFQFPREKSMDASTAGLNKMLASLLGANGASSEAFVRGEKDEVLPFTETRVWQNGSARIVGAWWQMRNDWFSPKGNTIAGKPIPAVLRLRQKGYVYDLRNGKYLGKTDEVKITLRQGRASFFLIQPFKTKDVDVELAKRPVPGEVFQVQVRTKVPAGSNCLQAVKVQLVAPDGAAPEWASQVILLKDGAGEAEFQMAFNAKPGKWLARATELFTGEDDEITWKIK